MSLVPLEVPFHLVCRTQIDVHVELGRQAFGQALVQIRVAEALFLATRDVLLRGGRVANAAVLFCSRALRHIGDD
jgi:hypothetical protein